MIEISKELLSEVLGVGVYQSIRKDEYAFDDIKLNVINTELLYSYINIYELAHKCKDWAWNNFGLNIFIEKHTFNLYEASIKICRFNNKLGSYNSFCSYYPKEKTEVEAVIKASEWILKELKK